MKWRQAPKYRAIKTEVDGVLFDSRAEAQRFTELKILQAAGGIYNLTLQPEVKCTVNNILICKYRGDFSYRETNNPRLVIEDKKGFKTPVYKLKIKLCRALFPDIEFRES